MKQLLTYIFVVLTASVFAQAPQSIPYQAVVRNSDGSVMASTAITITFKIHDNTATGTVVYEENHTATTNSQGLISLNVGNGTVVSGTFSGINWGTGSKFLHVLMNAGNGEVNLGTQQMMSVPYALYAEEVNVRVSVTGDSLIIGNAVTIVPGVSPSTTDQYYTIGDGVTDVDGNTYCSVIINGQEWMGENLKVTKFNDGTFIPSMTASSIGTGVLYRWGYPNDYGGFGKDLGKLYTQGVINYTGWSIMKNICPVGWHVPSNNEWTALMNYVVDFNKIRAKGFSENGTGYWSSSSNQGPDDANTNLYNFGAAPAGMFYYDLYTTSFDQNFGNFARYWSNTPSPNNGYYYMFRDGVVSIEYVWQNAASIRCIKD